MEQLEWAPLDKTGSPLHPLEWTVSDVHEWADRLRMHNVAQFIRVNSIDGEVLLSINEEEIRSFARVCNSCLLNLSDVKKLWFAVHSLQQRYGVQSQQASPTHSAQQQQPCTASSATTLKSPCSAHCSAHTLCGGDTSPPPQAAFNSNSLDSDNFSSPPSVDGGRTMTNIPPEFFKTAISIGYSFLVTWITSFVMVIVHERVPDMKRYPPLPDIFLDNVPHIPWAFNMCEITGTLLFIIWACVCVFHKYRMVLLRRFFALAGTVFLLRCVTMLITSLSVPGTHLQCNQHDYAVVEVDLSTSEAIQLRISRAYTIWSGLGMSIQGVRTCGDYMFSGHTVALTLLNFFITEYTPRNLYFLHTLSWLLNMFGIFFILAAHEHYSIDVFVAFYITSRLFLYYHTLANNQALMSRDSNRTRIWFPMFSYFESTVDGIIPNEYDSLGTLCGNMWHCLLEVKDMCMLTAQRAAFVSQNIAVGAAQSPASAEKQRHVATSTNFVATGLATAPSTHSAAQPVSSAQQAAAFVASGGVSEAANGNKKDL